MEMELKGFNGFKEIEMKTELIDRWKNSSIFIDLYENGLFHRGPPMGVDRKYWYKNLAPRVQPYLNALPESVDCRFVDISGETFGNQSLSYILDNGDVSNSLFIETGFQDGTAKDAKFSGSRFVRAQMSPYFATGANFEDCTFIKSFLYGAYASYRREPDGEEMYNGIPTDLTDCSFKRVVADDTDFGVCDFKGADFTEAYFEKCVFQMADLRHVKFTRTRFVKCSFEHAWLSDTPENRSLLERGDNLKIDTVVWKQVK